MISGYVESGGLSLAYHSSGEGEPVVFVHGAMADHRIWQDQIDHFEKHYHVVAWDGPGAGSSDDPPDGFSLDDYAACLDDLCGSLDLDAAHIVGHSFGGGLAIDFQHLYPARVRSLVLVGAYAGWAGSLSPEEVQSRLDGVESALASDRGTLVEQFMATLIPSGAPDHVKDLVRTSIEEFHPDGIRALSIAFAEADLRPVLPSIDVATTVVHGELDVRARLPVAEALTESIPGSVLRVIPQVGHESFQEDPDAFNQVLSDHLLQAD